MLFFNFNYQLFFEIQLKLGLMLAHSNYCFNFAG